MSSFRSGAWHSGPLGAAVIVGGTLAAVAAAVWTAGLPRDSAPSIRLRQPATGAPSPGSMSAEVPTLVVRGRYAGGRISGLAGTGLVYSIGGGGVALLAAEQSDGGFVARATGELLRRPCLVHISPMGPAGIDPFDPVLVLHDAGRGDLDVGELPAGGEGPVVIEGRVVDESGRAIAGAGVAVGARIGTWTLNMADAAAATDADGRFEWHAHVRGVDQLVVTLKLGWSAIRPVEARPGARGLVLRARRSFTRSGSVTLPPGMPLDGLVIQVCGRGVGQGSEANVNARSATLRDGVLEFPAQASFELGAIPDGVYDVFLRRRGSTKPLAEQRGWEPRYGDVPALYAEKALRTVTVNVLGIDGAPAPDARVWVREAGRLDRFGSASRTDARGSFVLAIDELAGRVAAHAPGCAFEFAEIDREVVTLRLREARPTTVVLRLPGGGSRPAPDVLHGLSLRWVGDADEPRRRGSDLESDDPRSQDALEADLSDAGVARIPVVAPGWYSVRAVVRRKDGSFTSSYAAGGGHYVRVDGAGDAVEIQLPSAWRGAFDRDLDATSPPR